MNRRLIAVLIALPVIHTVVFFLVHGILLLAAVFGLDVFFGLMILVFQNRAQIESAIPELERKPITEEPAAQESEPEKKGNPELENLAARVLEVLKDCLNFSREAAAGSEHSRTSIQTLEALQEALKPLQELTRVIYLNTHQAFEIASNLSGSAEQAFNLSHKVQSEVVSMSDELEISLSETENLLEESRKISDILEILSDLSANIHVLSINASIVAARAGMQGKAFDVVAKEVGKLSEKTKLSLKDIEKLLINIQGKVQSVTKKIKSVSTGIINEKSSLLTVAGSLQGVMLAVEVIQTVSSLSSQKAMEEQNSFLDLTEKVKTAASVLETGISESQILNFQEKLNDTISELTLTKT